MSKTGNHSIMPKSIRHKQILEVAADKPDASMKAIASEVPSATSELVERVLDDYGDPSTDHSDPTESNSADMAQAIEVPEPSDLTDKQLEALQIIAQCPEASQSDIAKMLDVSAATICNRVNSIEGFDWGERSEYVESFFEMYPETREEDFDAAPEPEEAAMASNGKQPAETNDRLAKRVNALEQRLNGHTENEFHSVFDDPALTHKIIRLCVASDDITEKEERQVLSNILK